MVIVGTGGQGVITVLRILAEVALIEGYDVKTSELHGLSQRGGSVEVHIKFGNKIHSPLVAQGKADLILGLEMQECLKSCYFVHPHTKREQDAKGTKIDKVSSRYGVGANSKTSFLINDYLIPILSCPPEPSAQADGRRVQKPWPKNKILKTLKNWTKDITLTPAAKICEKELGTKVVVGVYLLSLAAFKKLVPIKPASILKAMKKVLPSKYLELNKKTFNLARKND